MLVERDQEMPLDGHTQSRFWSFSEVAQTRPDSQAVSDGVDGMARHFGPPFDRPFTSDGVGNYSLARVEMDR